MCISFCGMSACLRERHYRSICFLQQQQQQQPHQYQSDKLKVVAVWSWHWPTWMLNTLPTAHPPSHRSFSFRHRSRWPLFIREMRHTPFIWKWPYFACYRSSQDLCCCRKIDRNTTSNNLRRKIVKQSRLSAEVFKERKGWKLCTGPNKQHSIPTLVRCSFSLSHSLSLSPFCLSLSIYIHK